MFVLAGIVVGCSATIPAEPIHQQKAQEYVDKGTLHLRRGEFDDARAAYLMSLEISPSAAAIDGVGCVAMLQGDLKEAEKRFRQAMEFDPGYGTAAGNLALLQESQGDEKMAVEMYRIALARDPENFRARNNYGGFLRERGNDAEKEYGMLLLRQAAAVSAHPLITTNMGRLSEEVE